MGAGAAPPTAPLLSVVVPAHQVEAYVAECLDSILVEAEAGTVEVIGVDDASPDRSGAVLDDYACRDPRVRVRHLPANAGLGQARNVGLEHARGDYVWFVDGDDWLPPGSLTAVAAQLTVHRPDVLVVDHAEVHRGGRLVASRPHAVLRKMPGPVRLADHPELLRIAQSACTKIARRALLDENKLRFAPGWYEDSSFSHPLLIAAESIVVLDRVCYYYRQHQQTITRTPSDRHFEIFEQYRRLFDWVDEATAPGAESFRPELFRLMIDHYLVVAGHEARVPPKRRREFFTRVAAEYRARLPAAGYPKPSGVDRLKHALVRWNAYRWYALLRQAYRPVRRLRRLFRTGPVPWRAARAVRPSPAPPGRGGGPERRGRPRSAGRTHRRRARTG